MAPVGPLAPQRAEHQAHQGAADRDRDPAAERVGGVGEQARQEEVLGGPELTAHALRGWCRLSSTATAYIEPGSPWQNPYVESFNARVRDEVLDVELFSSLAEAVAA